MAALWIGVLFITFAEVMVLLDRMTAQEVNGFVAVPWHSDSHLMVAMLLAVVWLSILVWAAARYRRRGLWLLLTVPVWFSLYHVLV
jgi:hypothetical protein